MVSYSAEVEMMMVKVAEEVVRCSESEMRERERFFEKEAKWRIVRERENGFVAMSKGAEEVSMESCAV